MAVRDHKPHGRDECFEAQQENQSKCPEPGREGSALACAGGTPPPALPRLTLRKLFPAELLILRGDKSKVCDDLYLQQSFALSLWLQNTT